MKPGIGDALLLFEEVALSNVPEAETTALVNKVTSALEVASRGDFGSSKASGPGWPTLDKEIRYDHINRVSRRPCSKKDLWLTIQ
jgi:hypothetical protein